MKLVTLPGRSTKDMLDVIDELREQVVGGQVAAFAAVTVEKDDTCRAWTGSTGVSRLRMQGGIAQLLHNYLNADL